MMTMLVMPDDDHNGRRIVLEMMYDENVRV